MLGRIITGVTVAIAALAVGVPFASAGNGIVDDSWRSARDIKAMPAVSTRLVDDYWRDSLRNMKPTAAVSERIVDDYFRDAPTAVADGSDGFDWGDFGIGIAVAVGSMLMLAGLGAGVLAARQSHKKTGPAATA